MLEVVLLTKEEFWKLSNKFSKKEVDKIVEFNKNKARKDEAKDILEKLFGYIGSQQQFCIVNDEHKNLIDCDKLFNFVGKLAKEKSVEVVGTCR